MTERFTIWLAWKLPQRLVYWCYIRLASEATVTVYADRTPDEISIMDVLRVS